MFSLRLSAVFLSPFVVLATASNCQCGFSINSTSDPEYQVFTQYLESDFTQGSISGWVPQEWAIDSADARGPYGKNATIQNVVLGADGMQLWVRQAVNGMIPMAEVDSERTDMLYGSFRMRAKMGAVNGTCGAMFWVRPFEPYNACQSKVVVLLTQTQYYNNTQEIDMEFLSKQFNESDGSNINLVIQSPESQAAGYNAVFTPGFALPHLPFRPDIDFHEYRFDWTPSQVAFYADSQLLHVMTENIPNSGGHMVFNHWSNGDPGWSAGPPTEETYITISHAHFYFNSSDPTVTKKFSKDCSAFDSTKVCTINNNITIALMPQAGAEVKHRDTTIYIIIGVVVGLLISSFIGCMTTARYWVALKNKLSRKISSNPDKSQSGVKETMDGPSGSDARTPDTELESQATPVKASSGLVKLMKAQQ